MVISLSMVFSFALLFLFYTFMVMSLSICDKKGERGLPSLQVHIEGEKNPRLRGRIYLHIPCYLVVESESFCFIITREKIPMFWFVFVSVVLLQENILYLK